MAKKVTLPKNNALAFPAELIGKQEIAERVRAMLHSEAEKRPATHLYLALKQIEYAVEVALEELKNAAITEVGNVSNADNVALTIGGHNISIRPKVEWDYGKVVEELKAEQKRQLDAERAIAKAEGIATKTVTGTVITVQLAP